MIAQSGVAAPLFPKTETRLNTQTGNDGWICLISGSGKNGSRPQNINQPSNGTKRRLHRTKESVQLQSRKRLSTTAPSKRAIIRTRRFQSQTRLCLLVLFGSVFLSIVRQQPEHLRSLSIFPNLRVSTGSSGMDHSIQTGSQRAERVAYGAESRCVG